MTLGVRCQIFGLRMFERYDDVEGLAKGFVVKSSEIRDVVLVLLSLVRAAGRDVIFPL